MAFHQMSYIFGPIDSNRLGRSLGIDLIPYKICNFDCIYCECGKTTSKVNRRGRFVNIERLIQQFEAYLSTYGEEHFDVVTLTGSGETTLEIQLGRIIWEIRVKTSRPIAVLTNASLMNDTEVQEALALADIVLPSLDAVSLPVFQNIDQPAPGITVENIIQGMIQFRKKYPNIQFWLEILFVEGINDTQKEIQKLKEAIELIQPHKVNVGTASRPPAYPNAKPISKERLKEIQDILCSNKTKSEMIDLSLPPSTTCPELCRRIYPPPLSILETLKRRPSTLDELSKMTETDENRIQKELQPLLEQRLLTTTSYEGKIFFKYRPPLYSHQVS